MTANISYRGIEAAVPAAAMPNPARSPLRARGARRPIGLLAALAIACLAAFVAPVAKAAGGWQCPCNRSVYPTRSQCETACPYSLKCFGQCTAVGSPQANMGLDVIFQAYASCHGLDWRVLKGIAKAESSLNPNAGKGKTYQGLFQISADICTSGLGASGGFLSCADRLDPEANTAAAATHIDRNLKRIIAACPTATMEESLQLLYMGHNNGPGVLRYVLGKGGCSKADQRTYLRDFYDSQPKGRFRGVDANWGEQKWKFGERVVNAVKAAGATRLYPLGARNNALCPAKTGQRVVP